MQITVYVPKDLEGRIREISKRDGVSVQQVLLGSLRDGIPDSIEARLDRIEEMLKTTLRNSASKEPVVQMDNKKTIRQKKIEEVKDKDLTPKISKSDQEMLEMAQELINKKRPDSLMGWNGGYSKEAQLKKGKKTN